MVYGLIYLYDNLATHVRISDLIMCVTNRHVGLWPHKTTHELTY